MSIRLLRVAETLGANSWQRFSFVTIPSMLPSVAAGMRVGIATAWTCVIVSEMIGAKSGIGFVLLDSYMQFQFGYVVACMLTLGLLGWTSDLLITRTLGRWLRWADKGAGR